MRTQARRFATLAMVVSLVGPAQGANTSSDKIGFGFDKLNWGMTQKEANALYHFYPGKVYEYAGCRFRVLASFEDDVLIAFDLIAAGTGATESCGSRMQIEMIDQYGQPSRRWTGADAVHMEWKNSSLDIFYHAWKLRSFDANGPSGFDGRVEVSYFRSYPLKNWKQLRDVQPAKITPHGGWPDVAVAANAAIFVVLTGVWLVAAVAWLYALFHLVAMQYVMWITLPRGQRLRGFLWPPIRDVSTTGITSVWLVHRNKVRRALIVFLAGFVVFFMAIELTVDFVVK